MIKISSPWTR